MSETPSKPPKVDLAERMRARVASPDYTGPSFLTETQQEPAPPHAPAHTRPPAHDAALAPSHAPNFSRGLAQIPAQLLDPQPGEEGSDRTEITASGSRVAALPPTQDIAHTQSHGSTDPRAHVAAPVGPAQTEQGPHPDIAFVTPAKYVTPYRVGMKRVCTYVSPTVKKQIKHLLYVNDMKEEELVCHALNLYFKSHGLPENAFDGKQKAASR